MLKKILKITGIVLLVLIIALVSIPFLFKDKIQQMVVNSINQNLDATVAFEKIDLSLLKNFPRATVTIDKLSIINKAPFEGDTLLYSGEINLKMSIKELFKGENETMNIESFYSKDAKVNILFDKNGIGNFDIALKDNQKATEKESKPFSLSIQSYEFENLKFLYFDAASKIKLVIDSLNHTGTGNFAASKLDLDTKTTARMTFDMDSTNYMKHVLLDLDAVLGIDLEQSKYTFMKNKALINKLPLEFNGFIQMVETGQNYDLNFKTPTSDFKNFLGVLPAQYAGNLNTVQTTGDFAVVGFAKGMFTDTTIPKFNIDISSKNASFKYPDLPKSVTNIKINSKIINESGLMKDTYLNLDQLSFRIDQDVFDVKANVQNITENPLIEAALKGTINLWNVSKAYPIKLTTPLSGILKADVVTKFDMQSIEKSQYEKVKNSGDVSITGFKYVDEEQKVYTISQAVAQFNPSTINLKQLDVTTGKTDLQINGVLENFYGFLFKDEEIKGTFNLKSNQIAVGDFMSKTDEKNNEKTTVQEAIKIPKFLNVTLNAVANTVLYDNLTLKNVSGKLLVKDETISLQNVKTNVFNGLITANGLVSTKNKVPTFAMELGLKNVDVQQSFTQLEMLKNIAPIAGIINGKLNSLIHLKGNLDTKEMTPDLKTLGGDLFGELLSTTVNASNSDLLTALSNNIKFIDLNKINFNDVKAFLTFDNGKVNVKPFDFKYQDIKVNVGGSHGFDQAMNYNLKFNVPAKYLGSEVNNLLAKLTPAESAKLQNIPVNAVVTGNFSQPKISTDIKQAVTNLANQLVEQQKQKLIRQGTNALDNLIKENTKPKDSTKTPTKEEAVKEKAKDLINGLFGGKKK
jgi:hypothetical protein